MKHSKPFDYASFDLPVPGVDGRYLKMPDLLRAFQSATIRDPEVAVKMGREMVARHYVPGQIAYARFLRTTASISMPRDQRRREAETILLRLDRELDRSPALEMEISLELAELHHAVRPVGELAALLRANRLGAAIPPERIERCRKSVLKTIDVNHLGDSPEDAYALGFELDQLGNARQFTEVFYRLAFDGAGDNTILKGKAALGLAAFYSQSDERTAAGFYQTARNCGMAELII